MIGFGGKWGQNDHIVALRQHFQQVAGWINCCADYKGAVAFVIILLVLFFMPNGLFGRRAAERV